MKNPWLCLTIVGVLGMSVIVGLIGIIALALYDKQSPESLVGVVSTAIGALASFLVSIPRGSVGVQDVRTKGS